MSDKLYSLEQVKAIINNPKTGLLEYSLASQLHYVLRKNERLRNALKQITEYSIQEGLSQKVLAEDAFEDHLHKHSVISAWETVEEKHYDGNRWLIGNAGWSDTDSPEVGFWNDSFWECSDISYSKDDVTHCALLPKCSDIPSKTSEDK